MQPTVDDRFDSFQNYIDLFNMILGLDTEVYTLLSCRYIYIADSIIGSS